MYALLSLPYELLYLDGSVPLSDMQTVCLLLHRLYCFRDIALFPGAERQTREKETAFVGAERKNTYATPCHAKFSLLTPSIPLLHSSPPSLPPSLSLSLSRPAEPAAAVTSFVCRLDLGSCVSYIHPPSPPIILSLTVPPQTHHYSKRAVVPSRFPSILSSL